MPAVTRIGDADVDHCSGMTRAVGSPNVFANNIPVSRQGDDNTGHLLPGVPCPSHSAQMTSVHLLPGVPCPSHSAPIEVGSPTVITNNVGTGRVGDAIAGCTSVAAGSPNVFAGP